MYLKIKDHYCDSGLGWHIPTIRDPEQEKEDVRNGRRGGDLGHENPEAYEGVLLITPSVLAGKVEFNVSWSYLTDVVGAFPGS